MKKLRQLPMFLIALSILLQASSPKIGDAIRQAQPPKQITEPKSKTLIKIDGIEPIYKPELKKNNVLKKVLVKKFKIINNIHIKSEILLPFLSTYTNKMLSFNDMQKITSIITKKYRNYGYIVARAYIPIQNMNNGILEISVIEGVYGKFKVINNSKIKKSLLKNIFDANKEGTVIHNNSLEKALLIANDIPGIMISNATIKAGDKAGSSDFLITVDDSQAYDGYILGNNYGGRYTGKQQFLAVLNYYSPLKIGDKLSFTGLMSDVAGLYNGSLSYSFPLYRNGLRGEVGYASTIYSLSEEFKNLDASGSAKSYYIKSMYPIIKKRAESLDIFIKVENNALSDEIKSTNYKSDKNLIAYRLGLDYKKTDFKWLNLNQQIKISMLLTHGKLTFKDATQKILDKAGVNTEGSFSKIEFLLGHNINITNLITLENSIKYQHALGNKNLDGSEDFSIGGAYGVKLYPSGELSAENGYLFSTEVKYKLQNFEMISHSIGLLYDRGRVYMENPTTTFEAKTLQDIGLNYYANYKKFFANIKTILKIDNKKATTEPDKNYKILFIGGFSF